MGKEGNNEGNRHGRGTCSFPQAGQRAAMFMRRVKNFKVKKVIPEKDYSRNMFGLLRRVTMLVPEEVAGGNRVLESFLKLKELNCMLI